MGEDPSSRAEKLVSVRDSTESLSSERESGEAGLRERRDGERRGKMRTLMVGREGGKENC